MSEPSSGRRAFWKLRQEIIDELERRVAELKAYRERYPRRPGGDPQLDELEAIETELLNLTKRWVARVVEPDEEKD
jgi:hypothetical protein